MDVRWLHGAAAAYLVAMALVWAAPVAADATPPPTTACTMAGLPPPIQSSPAPGTPPSLVTTRWQRLQARAQATCTQQQVRAAAAAPATPTPAPQRAVTPATPTPQPTTQAASVARMGAIQQAAAVSGGSPADPWGAGQPPPPGSLRFPLADTGWSVAALLAGAVAVAVGSVWLWVHVRPRVGLALVEAGVAAWGLADRLLARAGW